MAASYIDSYYTRTANAGAVGSALDGVMEVDVCVVGGGLAGLSTALGLVERGASVVLLEAHRVGWGASGRNGGFVSAGFSKSLRALERRLGRDHAQALYGLSRDAVALIRQRIETYAIDCGPIVDGTIRASWFDDPDSLKRERDYMAAMTGVAEAFWPREKLGALLLSERYYDGLFDPEGFQFHALNYSLGLAVAARSKGARIFEGARVTALQLNGPMKIIRTRTGEVRAAAVVMACGGYIAGLHRKMSGATIPVATYVAVTEPLGDRLRTAIRTPHAVHDTRFALDYYRPLHDSRILWGGRISVRQSEPPGLAGLMRGDLLKVYPQLAGVKMETAWGGLMSYATHKMPQIGEAAPRVWYAMGFGGHGVNTTTMAGELVAGAIAERDDRYRLLAPFGLTPTAGPIGAAAAQLTYWFYGLRDALKD
ncbi:MAG: FAD-binding oxidoreductase [Alphaproteobacteria bacterium]|nr:FAD-binding oxidoreductase [Alphaproteobacteria bacterium]